MQKETLEAIIDASVDIVFFGSAGVSKESGIPDFRSVNDLYNQHENHGRGCDSEPVGKGQFCNTAQAIFEPKYGYACLPFKNRSTPEIAVSLRNSRLERYNQFIKKARETQQWKANR